ncbi:MAG: hypothetical protein FJ104_15295 [Deltaproteobacteria bacterium]|nr:hypothetical protein [Deltaproteobacteria bacterium]
MIPVRRYVDGGPPPVEPASTSGDAAAPALVCDACGEPIEGSPAGAGLLLWTRGEEVRYEEPPLCERCAPAIARAGGAPIWDDDEEG